MKVLLKKLLVFVLVCSMVFSTTSFSVLADGINNESVEENESTEESDNAEDEESVEDDESVGASSASPEEVEPEDDSVGASEDSVGASEDSVGASSTSAEEEAEEETEEEETEAEEDESEASETRPYEDEEESEEIEEDEVETTVEASSEEDETEDGARETRPYEEEESAEEESASEDSVGASEDSVGASEASVGASSTSAEDNIATPSEIEELEEIDFEIEKKEKLFGAAPASNTTWCYVGFKNDNTEMHLARSRTTLTNQGISYNNIWEQTPSRTPGDWRKSSTSSSGPSSTIRNAVQTIYIDEEVTLPANSEHMGYLLFKTAANATSIVGLENLNLTYRTSLYGLFEGSKMETIDLSKLNIDTINDLKSLFSGSSIKEVDFSPLKGHISTNLSIDNLFNNCPNIEEVDLSVLFDKETSFMTGLAAFYKCTNLKKVNLAGLHTNSGAYNVLLKNMFNGCTSLTEILVSEGFDFNDGSYLSEDYYKDTFVDCTNLVGGEGTKYSDVITNTTYSKTTSYKYGKIDRGQSEGTSGRGLFTEYNPIRYNIVYDANGGSGTMDKQESLRSGKDVTLDKNTYTREHYKFLGWSDDPDATTATYSDEDTTFKYDASEDGEDITLYAVWQKLKYTVTYNSNGGQGTMVGENGESGVELTLKPNGFTRTGYIFRGWDENQNPADPINPQYKPTNLKMNKTIAEEDDNKNFVLYAIWTKISYKVVYDGNGATGGSVPDSQTGYSEEELTLSGNTGNLVKTNKKILGWDEDRNATTATYVFGTEMKMTKTIPEAEDGKEIKLYAIWDDLTYTIKLNPNGATGDAVSKTATSGEGFKLDANTFTRTHYKFLGWSEDQNIDADTYDVNADGNFADGATITKSLTEENYTYNLYAVWKKLKYKVNYNANTGEGTMEPSDGESGSNLALKANGFTKAGYRFRGWDTVNNPTDPTNPKYPVGSMTMNETLSANEDGKTIQLYAIWTQKKYTVKYNGNDETSGDAPADQTGYSDVELTLANNKGGANGSLVKNGKYLIGFSETSGDTAEYEVGGKMTKTITDAEDEAGKVITLYAVWGNVPYSIVLNSNGGQGSHDPIPAQSDVDTNLPANPFTRENYIFVGWSENQNIDPATFDANSAGNYPATNGKVNRTVDAEHANSKYEIFAIWKKLTYTLRYDLQGGVGSIDDVENIESGKEITLTSIKPTKGDDTFIGWAETAGKTSNPDYAIGGKFTFTVTTEGVTKTIYAVYNPKYEYTVTFNPNGGEGSIDSITATSSVDTPLPSNTMTRSGYTFVGWSDDSNDTKAKWTSSINKSVDSDGLTVELFAIWKKQGSSSGKGKNSGNNGGESGGGSSEGPANPKEGPMGDLTNPSNPNGINPPKPNGYNPLNPNGYNPLNSNGYNPLNPNGYNPLNPNGNNPLDPNGNNPLDPNGYNPLNPNGYNPLNPNGYNPLNPNGNNPLNPNGYNPLNPNGNNPLDPNDYNPLSPNGYNPLDPNGNNPLNPNGYNPLNPNGYNPLDPNGYNPLNPNGQVPENNDIVNYNNIPKEKLIDNDELSIALENSNVNSGSSYTNASDIYDNRGFGKWLKTDYTGDWYFYAGDKEMSVLTGMNKGFLSGGWYKVEWKNEADWYNFDSSGVMRSGWYNENGKIYYLIADRGNTFFGKMVTGIQVIDGETYQFDNNGVLVGKGR